MAYKQLIGSRQKNTDTTFRIKNGDPVKNKNGKGVKPYQAIDMSDYNRRQQMRSDSLAVFNASENIKNLSNDFKEKITIINPLVRKNIYKSDLSYQTNQSNKFTLLVVGGSQGANIFDEIIFFKKLFVSLEILELA